MTAITPVSAQTPDIESTGRTVPDQDQTQPAPYPKSPGAESQSAGESQMLGEYLAKHNAFCPLCRYNLRGLTGNTCPECGKLLAMTVGLVEPFMAPWICTTVTLCTSAGIGAFFLVMILFFGMPGSGGISSIFYSVTISCFVGCIPLVGSVIWLRRKFMKLHRPVQWNLAGISIVFVSLTFIFFVIAVAMDS